MCTAVKCCVFLVSWSDYGWHSNEHWSELVVCVFYQDIILQYNPAYRDRWEFGSLEYFIQVTCSGFLLVQVESGREFEPRPPRCRVTTLGKLFTPM